MGKISAPIRSYQDLEAALVRGKATDQFKIKNGELRLVGKGSLFGRPVLWLKMRSSSYRERKLETAENAKSAIRGMIETQYGKATSDKAHPQISIVKGRPLNARDVQYLVQAAKTGVDPTEHIMAEAEKIIRASILENPTDKRWNALRHMFAQRVASDKANGREFSDDYIQNNINDISKKLEGLSDAAVAKLNEMFAPVGRHPMDSASGDHPTARKASSAPATKTEAQRLAGNRKLRDRLGISNQGAPKPTGVPPEGQIAVNSKLARML